MPSSNDTARYEDTRSGNAADLEQWVKERLDSLTKPRGSLGRLEEAALRLAVIRGQRMPSTARKGMYLFCADHGVVAEGVSAYPQAVTRQMVENFVAGRAAISVLCRRFQIAPVIVDMGVCGPAAAGAIDRKIAPGTRNFAAEKAMTREQAERAVEAGRRLAEEAANAYDLVGVGEMGIGNTTSAAAILSVFSGRDSRDTVGPGAGLDSAGLRRKAEVIQRALRLHQVSTTDGYEVLTAVGGFEIAGIAGFLLGASKLRLPVVLDGFPCCAGALIARAIDPDSLSTAFYSHVSQEPGHRLLLDLLGARPYLDLAMRLGEGTGAALGMNLIDAAVALYTQMATFEEARVETELGEQVHDS